MNASISEVKLPHEPSCLLSVGRSVGRSVLLSKFQVSLLYISNYVLCLAPSFALKNQRHQHHYHPHLYNIYQFIYTLLLLLLLYT